MNLRRLVGRPMGKFLCALLAFTMATGPTAQLMAQQPAVNPPPLDAQPPLADDTHPRTSGDMTLLAPPDAAKIDLTFVTPEAVALVSIRPRQLLTSPKLEQLPVEVASAAGLEHLGIDPIDVEEILLFVEPPTVMGPLYGAVIRFSKPFAISDLPPQIRAHMRPAEILGKHYLQGTNPRLPSLYLADENTLLVMADITLRKSLEPLEAPQASPLRDRVRGLPGGDDLYAAIDIASLRPLINPWLNVLAMRAKEKFPADAKPFLELPNLISTVDLSFNITNSNPTLLTIHAHNEESADRMEELYELAMKLQQQNAAKEAAKLQQSDDPVQRAFGKYIERVSQSPQNSYKYQRRGTNLILFEFDSSEMTQNPLILVAVSGFLVALILPAIQAAREAARRNQSVNNMRKFMLAIHNYADVHKSFPAHAIYSKDGKPLLSWRVAILPYIEEQALYSEFHLDESWDSPHNKKLIPRMPQVFENPSLDVPHGKTDYLGVVGNDCIFDGGRVGIKFPKVTDGHSFTIALVEANADQSVEWTRPADWIFNAEKPMAGLGSAHPGGFLAAFADGSIQFISNGIDPTVLKAMFTRNGGEPVNRP